MHRQEGIYMKINNISLNLFSGKINKTTQTSNPFAVESSNPFAGGLTKDIFQLSNANITEKKQNIFAQKAAEFLITWNKGIENIKIGTKEFFAPAISFAGKVKAGYNKLNEMTLEDAYNGIKNQITLFSIDKDVKKYMNMPISDLRAELSKELAI